jgi:hypothetical protein
MICFSLLFIRLSLSHNSGYRFSGLTQVDPIYFFVSFFNQFFQFQFHSSTLVLLGIEFHKYFQFNFYMVISVL